MRCACFCRAVSVLVSPKCLFGACAVPVEGVTPGGTVPLLPTFVFSLDAFYVLCPALSVAVGAQVVFN